MSKDEEIIELKKQLAESESEKNKLINRSLKVHEENEMYKAAPALAAQMAEMEYQLKMAERFIKSKAFKCETPEQAYVIIKAGAEMGMQAVESMQALYCVNGTVKFYGDKMAARLTQNGYRIQYLNETENSVDVRVFNLENGFDETERVDGSDPILQKSQARKFAPKNKLRFHGIRMIASFHLPHLFGSVADEFSEDFHLDQKMKLGSENGIDTEAIDMDKERKRIADHIENAKTTTELRQVADLVDEHDLVDDYDNKMLTLEAEANG